MGFPHIPDYGIRRTVLRAQMASDAQHRVDGIGQQSLALSRPAPAVPDVFQIFIVEMTESGQDRIRGSLAQTAEGSVLDHLPEGRERLEILFGASAIRYLVQRLQKPLVAYTARRTFPARFLYGEIQIEPCDGNHTVILIHYYHSS